MDVIITFTHHVSSKNVVFLLVVAVVVLVSGVAKRVKKSNCGPRMGKFPAHLDWVRKGKGYIAVSAFVGSLAEAQTVPVTKPVRAGDQEQYRQQLRDGVPSLPLTLYDLLHPVACMHDAIDARQGGVGGPPRHACQKTRTSCRPLHKPLPWIPPPRVSHSLPGSYGWLDSCPRQPRWGCAAGEDQINRSPTFTYHPTMLATFKATNHTWGGAAGESISGRGLKLEMSKMGSLFECHAMPRTQDFSSCAH
eukprot:1146279-Pelagomonas_calceolata.AAC.5